jgi:hypothetical protein
VLPRAVREVSVGEICPEAALAARTRGAGEGEGGRRPCSPGKKVTFVPGKKAPARTGSAVSVRTGKDGEGRSPTAVRPPHDDASSRTEVKTPLAGQCSGVQASLRTYLCILQVWGLG